MVAKGVDDRGGPRAWTSLSGQAANAEAVVQSGPRSRRGRCEAAGRYVARASVSQDMVRLRRVRALKPEA